MKIVKVVFNRHDLKYILFITVIKLHLWFENYSIKLRYYISLTVMATKINMSSYVKLSLTDHLTIIK